MFFNKLGNNKVIIFFSKCFVWLVINVICIYVNLYSMVYWIVFMELWFYWYIRFCDIFLVVFIYFILIGCFMDNVCYDLGYKFIKDC